MAFIHASMIKNLVSDKTEELEKATKLAALALIKNVEFLSRLTEQ